MLEIHYESDKGFGQPKGMPAIVCNARTRVNGLQDSLRLSWTGGLKGPFRKNPAGMDALTRLAMPMQA